MYNVELQRSHENVLTELSFQLLVAFSDIFSSFPNIVVSSSYRVWKRKAIVMNVIG
jgi:hypothetical protein